MSTTCVYWIVNTGCKTIQNFKQGRWKDDETKLQNENSYEHIRDIKASFNRTA